MHMQLGKYYPYTEIMADETLPRVVRSIKAVLDPEGMINPGSLGLR
jgi:FAD linked oxidases, C-terminal domain